MTQKKSGGPLGFIHSHCNKKGFVAPNPAPRRVRRRRGRLSGFEGERTAMFEFSAALNFTGCFIAASVKKPFVFRCHRGRVCCLTAPLQGSTGRGWWTPVRGIGPTPPLRPPFHPSARGRAARPRLRRGRRGPGPVSPPPSSHPSTSPRGWLIHCHVVRLCVYPTLKGLPPPPLRVDLVASSYQWSVARNSGPLWTIHTHRRI